MSFVESEAACGPIDEGAQAAWLLGGRGVGCCMEQRLPGGCAAPQREELHLAGREVDLHSEQPVLPLWIDEVAPAHDGGLPRRIGAPQEDDGAAQRPLGLQGEGRGTGAAQGTGLADASGSLELAGCNIRRAALLQGLEVRVLEALPHLQLPAGIVALDGSLEACLSGRSEDRRDAQLQAQAHDPAQSIGIADGPLEQGGVVELDILGQPVSLPVTEDAVDHMVGTEAPLGPGTGQTAMHGHDVEHFDLDASSDEEALDDVEAVEFRPALCQQGQVPAARRGRTSGARPGVQQSLSQQDPADGANRGNQILRLVEACQQMGMDGLGTTLAESRGEQEPSSLDDPAHPHGRSQPGDEGRS